MKKHRKILGKEWLKEKNHLCMIVLGFITFLYIVFGEGVTGHVLGGDSEAYYINFKHHIGVAPLYPLLIQMVRVIVGSGVYLDVVAWLQMIFLTISIIYLVNTLQIELKLKWWETIAVWAASMIPFIILLPEDPIGHTIMTESLTYPLTYLVMTLIIKGIWHKQENCFVYSLLVSVIAGLVRSQMLFLFPMIGIGYFYMCIKKRQEENKPWLLKVDFWGRMAIACVLTVIAMKSITWITVVHERIFFDAPAVDYSDQTLVQHMLYLADEGDEQLFEDEDIREIFRRCYQRMMEQESNYIHQEEGLAAWRKIVADCGGNSRVLTAVIEEYYGDEMPTDLIEREVLIADISHEMAYPLLKVHWRDKIAEALDLIPSGFVSTVLFHKVEIYGIIHIFTLLFYVFGIGASVAAWCGISKNKKAPELLLLFLITSIVNVVACNTVHFGLQRYLAYTLGLNWIGMLLVVREYGILFFNKVKR